MSKAAESTRDDLVGTVLEVLPVLLAEGRTDEVVDAVRALVARNETLERQLAAMMRRSTKSNEGVSKDQLRLFLDQLQAQAKSEESHEERPEVDARLLARADAAAERAREKTLSEGNKPKR